MKKLVLLGGCHAHVEVLRRIGLRPMAGVELTLVSPDRHTPYSGMLPGLVAGHYRFDECHIDLEPLASYAGARYRFTTTGYGAGKTRSTARSWQSIGRHGSECPCVLMDAVRGLRARYYCATSAVVNGS